MTMRPCLGEETFHTPWKRKPQLSQRAGPGRGRSRSWSQKGAAGRETEAEETPSLRAQPRQFPGRQGHLRAHGEFGTGTAGPGNLPSPQGVSSSWCEQVERSRWAEAKSCRQAPSRCSSLSAALGARPCPDSGSPRREEAGQGTPWGTGCCGGFSRCCLRPLLQLQEMGACWPRCFQGVLETDTSNGCGADFGEVSGGGGDCGFDAGGDWGSGGDCDGNYGGGGDCGGDYGGGGCDCGGAGD